MQRCESAGPNSSYDEEVKTQGTPNRGDRKQKLVLACNLLFFAVSGTLGCRSTATSSGGEQNAESHFVRGQVVAVDADHQSVTLAHDAIAGFMPAMTMEYHVVDPAAIGELHPGDRIGADLLSDKTSAGPSNLRLANVDILAQARPDYLPKMQYHVPSVGEVVPDFKLLNQSDHKIGLAQFRGKVVALTFIYTRCPLADFCPRMSRNFAEMDRALSKSPALYAQTHLLSISFDPTYDTPSVLRSYGGAYTGNYTKETFGHWDFAAPSEDELPKMEQWFDVGVTPQGKTLQHSLATVILDKGGKVLAFYPTNSWTVDEALDVIRKAAAS